MLLQGDVIVAVLGLLGVVGTYGDVVGRARVDQQTGDLAAGDLGAPAAKKYDMEYWSPVNQKYQEITSCSNCTDFQARAVNCRVRRKDGSLEYVHTLNGTAVSLARALVVILENYATKDGKLKVPEVLRPYLNNKEEL